MIFQDFKPSPALQHLIRYYRLRHFRFPAHIQPNPKPYAARPEHCIAFFVKGGSVISDANGQNGILLPKTFLSGQFTHRINKQVAGSEMLMILVVFLPGAIQQLTGIPAAELMNTGINLADLWDSQTRELEDRLANATAYSDMMQLIDQFFLKAYRRKDELDERPVHRMFRQMMTGGDMKTVERTAYDACLSMRQLERYFQQYCGVSPSKMMQIVRFDQAYRLRLMHPEYSWLRIAMQCGYHDYQHMAKGFREFAHASPTALFSEDAQAPEQQLGLFTPGAA